MVFSSPNVAPIGTAFAIHRPGVVMTAAHVLAGHPEVLLVSTAFDPLKYIRIAKVVLHETADVAILLTEPSADLEWFQIGSPVDGYDDFPLGEEVEAYGFPMVGIERPIPPRLMQGHIQCKLTRKTDHYAYSAYELSFPAFHNLSGAPLFRSWQRSQVIGVVTDSTTYSSEAGRSHTHASWTLASALLPLKDWISAVTI